MGAFKWLAVLPFFGLIIGIFWANRVTPYVFGMPFILFYIILWVLLTSIIMAIIYNTDPANKKEESS